MKLHLSLLLETQLKNGSIVLSVPLADGTFRTMELKGDKSRTVEYRGELDYSNLPKFIKIFWVDGFDAGLDQKIIIKEMKINDRPVETASFFNLLDFFVRDNNFVSDRQIDNCHEICFNGELLLAVEKNRDRLFWCPYYYSGKKDDFVFMNYRPDDYISDVGPQGGGQGISKLKDYRNIPHNEYDVDKIYDVAVFGCSVTYGTFLETKNFWSNLLSKNSLNLAVPGLGVDGIFLNLKNSLKKFKFEKIIILLPNFERRLLRVRLFESSEFCRIPITALDWAHSRFKGWAWDQVGVHVSQEQVGQWKKQYNKQFINLLRDEKCIYGKRVFSLLLSLCNSTNKKFYFSSWDQEAYDHIVDTVDMSNILPFFKTSDRAKDNVHPGVRSHAAWANEVSKLVNMRSQN